MNYEKCRSSLSSVTPNRMRKNKRKSGKAGGVVRHSGWHSTWKAREAQIAAGTLIQGDPEVENDVKTSTVLREQQVDKMKKEETKDLIGYLNFSIVKNKHIRVEYHAPYKKMAFE